MQIQIQSLKEQFLKLVYANNEGESDDSHELN